MRKSNEKGLASIELVLAMPLIVFAILFLIGMGYALLTKNYVINASSFAAQHERLLNTAPTEESVGQAVSKEGEQIRLSGGNDKGVITYQARLTPQKGLLAQKFGLNAATSQHQLMTGTGICTHGTFLTPCKTYREK